MRTAVVCRIVPARMEEKPTRLRTALRGRYELEREIGKGGMATVYRDPLFADLALNWPGLGSLRSTPEYAALLKDMGWDKPIN